MEVIRLRAAARPAALAAIATLSSLHASAGPARAEGAAVELPGAAFLAASSLTRWDDGHIVADPTDGLARSAPQGHEPPRRLAAGFRVGYVTNLRKTRSPAAVADLSMRLPVGGERFEVAAEIAVWSRQLRESDAGDMVTTSLKVRPLRSRLIYELPLGRVSLFGGAGGGLILTRIEVSSPGVASSRIVPVPTAGALVGARLRAGRGRVGVEAGWWHARIDRPELRGSLGGLEMSAGYAIGF